MSRGVLPIRLVSSLPSGTVTLLIRPRLNGLSGLLGVTALSDPCKSRMKRCVKRPDPVTMSVRVVKLTVPHQARASPACNGVASFVAVVTEWCTSGVSRFRTQWCSKLAQVLTPYVGSVSSLFLRNLSTRLERWLVSRKCHGPPSGAHADGASSRSMLRVPGFIVPDAPRRA